MSSSGRITDISAVTESSKLLGGEVAGKAVEGVLVDVSSLAGQGSDSIVNSDSGNIVLELDNVIVGNDLSTTGRQERSGLSTLGWGSQDSRGEQRKKTRQLHDGMEQTI